MFVSRMGTKDLKAMQDNVDEGQLRIRLYNETNGAPVSNARVIITYTGGPQIGRASCRERVS